MPKQRRIIIIAGPNGAGKTTFAREYLLKEAGRLMLLEIERRVRKGESFAFETTLSGHLYGRLIPKWRKAGYHVKLIFLSLPNPEMAIARVKTRVVQGGHNVRSTIVRRRFDSGLRNFQDIYMSLVDRWWWYDNSGPVPQLISDGGN